jgi:hypothetical protein
VGWSDLGWAMENLWALLMGRQNKNLWATKQKPMSTSKSKDNNKSKQNYPNYQMQVMLHVEASTLFIQQQQQVVESQQIQPTGEQLSIVIGDECVGQA